MISPGDMYNEGFKAALRGAFEIVENNNKVDAITELVIALGSEE